MHEHQIIHHPFPGYVMLACNDTDEQLWHRLIATTWHDGFNIAISRVGMIDANMLVRETPVDASQIINLTRAQAQALRDALDEYLNERTA